MLDPVRMYFEFALGAVLFYFALFGCLTIAKRIPCAALRWSTCGIVFIATLAMFAAIFRA